MVNGWIVISPAEVCFGSKKSSRGVPKRKPWKSVLSNVKSFGIGEHLANSGSNDSGEQQTFKCAYDIAHCNGSLRSKNTNSCAVTRLLLPAGEQWEHICVEDSLLTVTLRVSKGVQRCRLGSDGLGIHSQDSV
jgi:hypothetical protein